jgi:hypothetical protein
MRPLSLARRAGALAPRMAGAVARQLLSSFQPRGEIQTLLSPEPAQ